MKCTTCGEPTNYNHSTCTQCFEVETRIDKYLESREGLHLILNKINVIQMRRELEKRGLKLDGENK